MNRFLARSLTVVLAAGAALAVATTPASAHETRADGPVRFVVGWGDEPTYTGFKNSVQVIVTEASGAPVTDLGDTLKVEVIKGTDKATLPLVANFRVDGSGTPGDYRAWLTPTRPGSYTFRLHGTVRGQTVDESFASSKTTFNEVQDMTSIAFPAKDPSTGQLATRLDRAVPRLERALAEAEDQADGARTLALAGVVAGAAGLLTGVCGLVLVRRRGGSGAGPRQDRRVAEMARPNA